MGKTESGYIICIFASGFGASRPCMVTPKESGHMLHACKLTLNHNLSKLMGTNCQAQTNLRGHPCSVPLAKSIQCVVPRAKRLS